MAINATGEAETFPSEMKRDVPENEETALLVAKVFAEQTGAKFPLGFMIDRIWYVYPNATTVHFAHTIEEAQRLLTPSPS